MSEEHSNPSILVMSEEVAKILDVEIKPYDKSRTKAVTADGKEVQNVLVFAVVNVTLGNHTLKKVRVQVFKNASNPCLIGRDVLAVHPETKSHFDALMNTQECECSTQQSGSTQEESKQLKDELREYLKTGKITKCKNKHCDRSSEDDGDEMDDILNDNSNVKGCWAKNKSRIDNEAINTKVPINMDRKMCKSKINNSIEKRTSIVENIYDCSRDHNCDASRREINALECPTVPANTPKEEIIFIRALDIILEDSNSEEELLTSEDEAMVISPNSSVSEHHKPKGR